MSACLSLVDDTSLVSSVAIANAVGEYLELTLLFAVLLADMHGFSGGLILCSDVSLTQYLYGSDYSKQRLVKLNDFNIASIPQWNTQESKYCKVDRPRWAGRVSFPDSMLMQASRHLTLFLCNIISQDIRTRTILGRTNRRES